MVVVGDAATRGEKELRRDWPHEEGLTAGTTKQEGKTTNLVAEEGSNVPSRELVGL